MIRLSSHCVLCALCIVAGMSAVSAQPPGGASPPAGAADEAPERARAPIADAASLEPAVDFGGASPAVRAPRSAAAPVAPTPPAAPAAPSARTIDSLDLGTTSITGNQELPKVLYIVPWKRSDLGDLAGRPVNTLLDEVLAPIDPDVFERHLDYYETLYGDSQEE